MIGAITAGLFSVAGAPAPANSYESISTVTVGAVGVSSVSFTSIPSTYKHLQIRAFSVCSTSANNSASVAFNSDTTATNYYFHRMNGNGTAVSATAAQIRRIMDNSGFGNYPATSVIDIVDYANTSKYKTTRVLNGIDDNNGGSGQINISSLLWNNTAAISSITISSDSANWNQYTSFALYGIKG